MNRLTSQQRKLVYLGGILILLIPIILLGMPASGKESTGGVLPKLRQPAPVGYDLGETTLGKVDPSSATMNLVLLGLRGIATNLLWMDALENGRTHNWGQLRTNVESIVLLQPHFLAVWDHQGHNLAYNVSAEWDGVADRYYWVKEGAKFYMQGAERNQRYPDLFYDSGHVFGKKIGRSDEWRQFRKFFNPLGYPNDEDAGDPDRDTWPDGIDTDVNPDGKDNYIVAHDRFQLANEIEETQEQHKTTRILFRQYPAKSMLDYPEALQREGAFDEVTRVAWGEGYRLWTEEFGREIFTIIDPFSGKRVDVRMESTPEDTEQLAADQDIDKATVEYWTMRYQNMCNYRYWRTRALSENDAETVIAHRELYEGQQLFKTGDFQSAREKLESGMRRFEQLLGRYPQLASEDNSIEEALTGVVYWQAIYKLMEERLPDEYPLKSLWDKESGWRRRVREMFQRDSNRRFE